ncbi:ABC transporter, partial [Stenotrophomonas maltophilia]
VAAAFERGLQQVAQDVVGWTLTSGQNDKQALKR